MLWEIQNFYVEIQEHLLSELSKLTEIKKLDTSFRQLLNLLMYDSFPSLEVEYYEYREELVLILVYLQTLLDTTHIEIHLFRLY